MICGADFVWTSDPSWVVFLWFGCSGAGSGQVEMHSGSRSWPEACISSDRKRYSFASRCYGRLLLIPSSNATFTDPLPCRPRSTLTLSPGPLLPLNQSSSREHSTTGPETGTTFIKTKPRGVIGKGPWISHLGKRLPTSMLWMGTG